MSLVGSAALFRSNSLYLLKDNSDLSASIFDSDNHGITCYTDESYSSYDPYQITYNSELDSPDDQDNNKMRSKLQELERALFDEEDTDNLNLHPMEIDTDWSNSACHQLLLDSPNISSSSSECSIFRPQSPKQLLFECAAAISNGNFTEASGKINNLRQHVSIQGDPSERIAAYMVEALVSRMAKSGEGLYRALKCKEAPSPIRLAAMQVLIEACPCFRFGFTAANAAILEVVKDEKRVHIIDFDINQGSQYYTLLQTLAKTPGKRPRSIILTGVDDPESIQRPVGGLNIIGQRLEQLAKDLDVPFEFRSVAAETAMVEPSSLDLQNDETALVVNFAFQLHHLPDESVSTVNIRDRLLRMVKGLGPKIVTVVEQDLNTNTAPFMQRFGETYEYYEKVFESLDATLSRDSQDRMNVEKHCLARDIINVVACEGAERIERYEVAGKWRSRMMMAGFTPCQVSRNVQNEMKKVIKQYSERFKVKEEKGGLHFGWEDKTLVVSSTWR